MSRTSIDSIETWIFPAILGTVGALHATLVASGAAPWIAAWIPAASAAVAVASAELVSPARQKWRPTRHELGTDAAFMLCVQVLLPQALTLLAALKIADLLHRNGLTITEWWPVNASHIAQLALALIVTSFTRYWLHRAAHTWHPLWRLHAVHHSPDKLYWLNVGRFHPLEKIIQFGVETLPLILLGGDEHVLGSYFVLYATIGFLEHSNIRMRNPWLGYVFSTAELHRRHHARDPVESSCNFGNMLMIWDVVFGTRRAPLDDMPRALGLHYDGYPRGFLGQLASPFRGSLYAPAPGTGTATARSAGDSRVKCSRDPAHSEG